MRPPISPLADASLAAVLGALHSVPSAFPQAWPLQLATVVLLVCRLGVASTGRAALLGASFGSAWLAAGVWWLFISMHRYGGLPAWMAALAVAALSFLLALYLSLACALFTRWRCAHVALDALLLAALWLAAELARGVLFTGFPWLASGYAHVESPLAALSPWIGVYGIGFVAALMSASVGLAVVETRGRRASFAALSLVVVGVAGAAAVNSAGFTQSAGRIGVTLLQTNVAQDQKFAADRLPQAMDDLAAALAAARGSFVVAPETAIPLLPDQLDPAWWRQTTAAFRSANRAALIGAPLGSYEKGYTNSALGLSAEGEYRYDKHHLVPFGEFIPRGFRWFVDRLAIPLGDFNRGPLAAASFDVLNQRVAPNICYEDLFGEELAARFSDASRAPTMFANLSNIGWFGDTIAIDQHLQISRARTLEFERPMLRATNTGATAVIDHRGRVVEMLAPFTRGALDSEVEGRNGLTPYARWASRFGLWPLLLLSAAIVFAFALNARRTRDG